MDKLKQYITHNKEAFEEEMPQGHLDRFRKKQHWQQNFLLRNVKKISVAATVLILLSVGGNIYLNNMTAIQHFLEDPIHHAPLPQEVVSAIDYYSNATTSKYKAIKALDIEKQQKEEISAFADQELKEYEKNKKMLTKQLREYPDNEKIKRAIIVNEMNKEAFMQKILNQVENLNTTSL